jgi:hypothetical protein
MTDMRVTVSLNRTKLREATVKGATYDIGAMIKSVPTATVVSGDTSIAVQVKVDEQYIEQLRKAVAPVCNVNPFKEYPLLDSKNVAARPRMV